MTGVLATVRLMFTALPLQRWFLRAGVLLALIAAAAMIVGVRGSASWWPPLAIVASYILLVVFPLILGGVLLRHLAASRAVRLMPHGRLQLLLGSLLAELLIASIAAAAVAALVTYAHRVWGLPADRLPAYSAPAAAFVAVFAIATFSFIGFYYGSGHRLGFLGLMACPFVLRELSVEFPHWPVHELLASTRALCVVFAGTSGLWALLAIAYLSAGRIARPMTRDDWAGESASLTQWLAARGARASLARSGRIATGVLLTGKYFGHRIAPTPAGIAAGVLFCYYLWTARGNPALEAGEERFLAVLIGFITGVMAAASAQPMIGRARYLWLKTRLDRGQLFGAVEAESWRTLVSVSAFALTIAAFLCFLAQVPWAILTQILLLSFVSGAAMIYAVLLGTRGWRLTDVLLITALSGLWIFGMLQSMVVRDGSWLLSLLAAQLLLVPLLRTSARYRWTRIDWIVNRPSRRLSGLT